MKLSRLYLLLGLAATGFTACENVDEAERFDGPVAVEEILAKSTKNILVEDFTGQKCVNCPKATDVVHQMQQQYGKDRVVAVAIHGGSLALEEGKSKIGLANPTGIEYHKHWNLESWPKGLIDRHGGVTDFEQWQGSVVQRFTLDWQTKVELSVTPVYDAATRQLKLTAAIEAKEGVDGKLQVWLTESNIKMRQYMPDGSKNDNYIHNHVFRASVNDPYGDPLTLAAGETQTKDYTYELAEKWVPENMALVVFYYNEADGVMQVIEKPVIAKAE